MTMSKPNSIGKHNGKKRNLGERDDLGLKFFMPPSSLTSIKFEAYNQNNELSLFTEKDLFAQAYDLITIFCFLHALCKVHSGVL